MRLLQPLLTITLVTGGVWITLHAFSFHEWWLTGIFLAGWFSYGAGVHVGEGRVIRGFVRATASANGDPYRRRSVAGSQRR